MTNDATTNVGFKGPITSAQLPSILSKGAKYSILSAGGLKVTAAAGTRALSVAAGTAWGDGVLSTWATASPVTLDAVASSGYRWDTIYIRRTWQPGSTPTGKAEIIKVNGSASKTISARTTAVGTGTADQPLALVRVDYGSTAITEIVDLRVWGADSGGLYANSVEVTQYVNDPGARILIGDVLYNRVVDPSSGAVSWEPSDLGSLVALTTDGTVARLQTAAGMRFSVSSSNDSIFAQKPGPTGPITTFQVTAGGDIVDGNLPYGSLYGETSQETGLGTNGAGFDLEYGKVYRKGDHREIFLEIRAGSLKVVNSAGQVGDLYLFTLDTIDRPRRTVPLTILYRGLYRPDKSDAVAAGALGALVGGAGYIGTSGLIRFTSGLPNHDVLSFPTTGATANTPTFYIHAMWGV
jgi:hypothetical protein